MKFRICRICEQFPPLQGGLSTGMLQLSLAQYRQGHDVVVITKSIIGDRNFDLQLPFNVVRVGCSKTSEFSRKAYNVFKKLKPRPDILHTHGPSAFYFSAKKKWIDIPIVHTVHSVRKYQYKLYKDYVKNHDNEETCWGNVFSYWSPRIIKDLLLEYVILKRVDHLCLVAGYFKKKLFKYYNLSHQKTTVVLNGTNYIDSAVTKSEQKSNTANKNQVILFVGRFDWHKRLDVLVRAHALIVKEMPTCKLLLIGDGENRLQIEDLIKRLRLVNSISLTGWIDPRKLESFYRHAKCICLPSICEGLPKVLLEAMSFGLPVIASNNLAHKELLRCGKYGELIENYNPEVWAEVILRVINGDTIVQTKAEKAKQLVENNYRWEHVAKRVNQAYEKVMSMYS